MREVTGEALRELGYEVLEAGNGGAALEVLEGLSIDLLIIDLPMPGMSGAELAARVSAKWPKVPVLFITGFADRSLLANIREAHIVGKPFAPSSSPQKAQSALLRSPALAISPCATKCGLCKAGRRAIEGPLQGQDQSTIKA